MNNSFVVVVVVVAAGRRQKKSNELLIVVGGLSFVVCRLSLLLFQRPMSKLSWQINEGIR